MTITRRIANVPALLVAGVLTILPAVALGLTGPASSASAAPKPTVVVTTSGAGTLAFDDTTLARLANAGVRISAKRPATQTNGSIVFRLAAANLGATRLQGGLAFKGPTDSAFVITNPILRLDPSGASGDVTAETTLGRLRLIAVNGVTTRALDPVRTVKGRITTIVRTTVLTGAARFIDDPAVVLMVNGAIGAYAFTPSQSLGSFTTRLIETTTVTKAKR